jgi:hypothetical protein
MPKLDLDGFARALLGLKHPAPTAPPEFASTLPWGPGTTDEEAEWHQSSFDLRRGVEMIEQPMDTLPGELQELFRRF